MAAHSGKTLTPAPIADIAKARQSSHAADSGLRAAIMAALPRPPETALKDLVTVLAAAVRDDAPWLVQSIFGRISTWAPPYWRGSELNVLDYWEPLKSARYLIAISVPSFGRAPGKIVRSLVPPLARRLFWRPSFYYQQTDPFGSVTSFLDERWFFINGVATDPKVARMNTQLLSELFGRPITGIYNATNSLPLDLIQCAIGKRFRVAPDPEDEKTFTRPAFLATRAILARLMDPTVKRIVVIAHSQGTIIAANVLRAIAIAIETAGAIRRQEPIPDDLGAIEKEASACLIPDGLAQWSKDDCHDHFAHLLGKMEFYLFANCADRFNYALTTRAPDGQTIGLPYLENFANEHDIIARLGVLSPLRETSSDIISIDGPLYLQRGDSAWGHFLNAHHLKHILDHLRDPSYTAPPFQPVSQTQSPRPRLYRYFDGQRP